jgi:hypothetical protein
MALSQNETVTLLQIVGSYDRRIEIDKPTILAWMESARRRNWKFADAVEAVHDYYADATGSITPGHVTQAIRAARRQPAPVSEVLELGPPPASAEHRARQLAAMIGRLADRKRVSE